jgi:uroporphyrinogen-III synthase
MAAGLGGIKVMLTRSEAENEAWAIELSGQGAEAFSVSTVEKRPVRASAELRQALSRKYDWLVFTSDAGVQYYVEMIGSFGLELDSAAKVAVVGEQTAKAARSCGLAVGFVPSEESGLALAAQLPGVRGQRILRIGGSLAGSAVSSQLKSRGAIVTDAVVYETDILTSPDPEASPRIKADGIDVIVFASPSAAQGFECRVDEAAMKKAKKLPAVAIGPNLAAELKSIGFDQVIVASSPSLDGVIEALGQVAARL